MRPLRSVGARLSLALALVVLLALGVVYAIVVPSLERNLVQSRLDQLAKSGELLGTTFPGWALAAPDFLKIDRYVEDAAAASGARVELGQPVSRSAVRVVADSSGRTNRVVRQPLALKAASTWVPQRAIVERGGKRYAQFAYPVVQGGPFDINVLLFSASLDDTLANVELVKRRVLIAGAAALLLALVIGYGGAWLFARRIRRLERAAERIASGRLDEPVIDGGGDELGQLATAFERMRGRLAQLEHARREFIANASHELRTPIFSLGGFLELLADEELDPATRREFLATMREQLERLTKLTTDLLDLSRLDAGRLDVQREPVDLALLAETLADEFAALARADDRALEVVVDGDPPPALADELRVLQIGRILVENALRHTPPATPVTIHVRRIADVLELAVEDGGPGIPAEHVEQVFERFYRVDGGVASGSGLGLAIARELAQLMRGTLTAESGGNGTRFSLRLRPAAAPAVERRAPAVAPG